MPGKGAPDIARNRNSVGRRYEKPLSKAWNVDVSFHEFREGKRNCRERGPKPAFDFQSAKRNYYACPSGNERRKMVPFLPGT